MEVTLEDTGVVVSAVLTLGQVSVHVGDGVAAFDHLGLVFFQGTAITDERPLLDSVYQSLYI